MTETHLTETRFDGFDLDSRIQQGLADAGFTHCTPIQAQALPIALAGHDVAGQAQTGTGKTAAFVVALLQRLLRQDEPAHEGAEEDSGGHHHQPRALVVAPTRELAVQIHKDTVLLARHTDFRVGLVFGGTGYQQQRDAVAAGVDILIGTPGRLIDYFKQRVFNLKHIEVVVLDEADRMFDLGFIKDIRFILRRTPPPSARLGMLFSATLSYRVMELAYEHMNNPQLVKVESDTVTADRVRQVCYMTANEEKIPLLIGLVRSWAEPRAMVFVNTKREADRVWGYLQGNGIDTAILSGDVPQKKRLKLLKRFAQGELPVLVATDVAARGLHIPDVTHVINYDLPEDAEDYVHRIGRTARAGAEGDAVSFACERYSFGLPDIEAFIDAHIPVAPIDDDLLVEVDPKSRLRPAREDREYRREGRGGKDGHHGRHRDREAERRPRRRRAERKGEQGPRGVGSEEAALTSPPPPSPDGQGTDASVPKAETPEKKRRRRRRKPKPAADAGAQDQAVQATSTEEPAAG